ncbi:MAG: 16S rRNA (guanine(966)-N(2))-methyltransferase RsmD [Pseudomonadota bacterium]
MRIVAGRFKGKSLDAPKGMATRPTTDRVREALFNVLTHGAPEIVFGEGRALDLFAGSGALGLEALSRGARYCLFIEEDAGARGTIRRNVEVLGLTGATKIWRRDATRPGPIGTMTPFDLVFCDPPYGKGLGPRAILAALDGGWLASGATVVLEDKAGELPNWPRDLIDQDLVEIDRRRYGDTEIAIARYER